MTFWSYRKNSLIIIDNFKFHDVTNWLKSIVIHILPNISRSKGKLTMKFGRFPSKIRVHEDVLKSSFVFVFSRRFQDVLMKTNLFALSMRLQKTTSRRLQDVLVQTNKFVLAIRLQDVFKSRFQCFFKMSSKRLEAVLQKRLQDVLNTSSRHHQRHLAKMSSIRFQDVSSS